MLQEPPFSIQLEMTEGCNLRCDFCGVNGIRSKERVYKFMTKKNAKVLADRIKHTGWVPRIEFAMHGEPTWNPDYLKIIKIFRRRLPKSFFLLVSNGGAILKNVHGNIQKIFEAGINTIAFDEYNKISFVPKIREKLKKEKNLDFKVFEYPEEKEGNPHMRRSITTKMVTLVAPIDVSSKGTHSSLNNHCGSGAPLNDNAVGARCAKPFREISIRYDGKVALCCNDWRGIYNCGNVLDIELEELWNNERFVSARKKLYHRQRDFAPCLGCDAKSYRVGFLPDKKGKLEMGLPGKKSKRIIMEVLSEKPMAKTVKRSWE